MPARSLRPLGSRLAQLVLGGDLDRACARWSRPRVPRAPRLRRAPRRAHPGPGPKNLLAGVAKVLFGLPVGVLLSCVGSLASAVVTFAMARRIGREAVASLTGARIRRVEDMLHGQGLVAVLLARLSRSPSPSSTTARASAGHLAGLPHRHRDRRDPGDRRLRGPGRVGRARRRDLRHRQRRCRPAVRRGPARRSGGGPTAPPLDPGRQITFEAVSVGRGSPRGLPRGAALLDRRHPRTTTAPTTRPMRAEASVLTTQPRRLRRRPPRRGARGRTGRASRARRRRRAGSAADPEHRDDADGRQRGEQLRHPRDEARPTPCALRTRGPQVQPDVVHLDDGPTTP